MLYTSTGEELKRASQSIGGGTAEAFTMSTEAKIAKVLCSQRRLPVCMNLALNLKLSGLHPDSLG